MRRCSSAENTRAASCCSHCGRYLPEQLREQPLGALEDLGEHYVETVVVAFVLHQAGAREVIEVLGRELRDARRERLEQRQKLGDRDRHAGGAQLKEETHQHRRAFSVRGGA